MTIKKHIKFLSIGMVAVSTTLFVEHNLTHSLGQQEAQAYFDGIQQNEELPTQTQAVHQDFTGSWAHYLGQAKAQVNLALATTNILKIFAPTDYFKADTKGIYIFTALHEFSHAQLYRMLEQPEPVFRLGQTSLDLEQQKLVEQKMDSYLKNNRKNDNFLVQTFHENFADTYASVLMIRDFAGRYSDKQIEQILQARYTQVHNQKTFLYGGFGDISHRTDFSVHHIQHSSFDDIRQMTPAQAKDFALKTATEGSIKQLTAPMQALFQNKQFQENLTSDTLLKLNELVSPEARMNVSTQAEFSSKESGILNTNVNANTNITNMMSPSYPSYVSERIGHMRQSTLKVKSSMIKRG
jgi:hypothetical protein